MNAIETLVAKLQAIAKKNGDEFSFTVEVSNSKNTGFRYYFKCLETADGHTFTCGAGSTIEEACAEADSEIAEACRAWDYEL